MRFGVAPVHKQLGRLKPGRVIGWLLLVLLLVVIAVPNLVSRADPYQLNIRARLNPPSQDNLFGTDEGGRDIFSRVVHGARYSIGMALAVVVGSSAVGCVYGVLSGYFGGATDALMMRVVDVFLSFPYLILAMAIASSIGRSATSSIIALVLVWWPGYARMIRGQVVSLKEEQFVEAARAAGAHHARVLFRHILPCCLPQIRARMTMDMGYVILALTGLSFLGLGPQNPSPEWGLMVSNGRMFVLTAWWYAVFPGIAIFLSVLAFTLVGD